MSEFEPPHPGWWRASDGNSYPPQARPSDATDLPAPTQLPAPMAPIPPAPPPQFVEDGSSSKPLWKRWWALAAAGAVALLVIVGIAAGGSEETGGDGDTTSASSSSDSESDKRVESDQPTDGSDVSDGSDQQDVPATDPQLGTREQPLAFDALVPIAFESFGDADGSVWNALISPPSDITDEVLSENQFNDPPPDGIVFAGFDVEMTLASASKEPLSPGFNFSWELLGAATSRVYDSTTIDDIFGCGVTPNEFDNYSEVFVGGTLTGTVCIPVPVEDLESAATTVALNFGGDRIVFARDGATPSAVDLGSAGDAANSVERGWETSVPVTMTGPGDAHNSIWNMTISPPRDVTEAVLAANDFNDPPPEGVVFAGFDVEMTLASAGKEPLSPSFNMNWEILGGSTAAVYAQSTIAGPVGCGVTPNEFVMFGESFIGGTTNGVVCIPLPAEDLAHPGTRVAMNFGGDRAIFLDAGPTPEPAAIEFRGGPSSVGDSDALGTTVEVGDESSWALTVDSWRDITAEVLEENPFNDDPPTGFVLAAFDVDMTLLSSDEEPQSTGFGFTWEVLGGDSARVFHAGTLPNFFGCGVVTNEFDQYAEVFESGTVTGTVCIPIPASDLIDPDTRIALNIRGDRTTFAPGQ